MEKNKGLEKRLGELRGRRKERKVEEMRTRKGIRVEGEGCMDKVEEMKETGLITPPM